MRNNIEYVQIFFIAIIYVDRYTHNKFSFIRKILLYKITYRRKIYLCVILYTDDITHFYFLLLAEISLI